MSSSVNVYINNGSCDKLLSYLMGLDQLQLEEFKLCLQSPELLFGNFQKIPWANLKASDPANMLSLLGEYFSERQIWEVTLSIFENMNLTSLCVEVRAILNGEWVHRRDGGRGGTEGHLLCAHMSKEIVGGFLWGHAKLLPLKNPPAVL